MKHIAMHNLFLYVICTTWLSTAIAQDPCSGPSNINIEFPERDPPATITPGDSQYAQVVLHGNEPFSVTIESDQSAPSNFPFDEYFSHSYQTFGITPGYTVYMVKGIDRDGATCGPDDDINILQYMLACRSTPTSDPLFKILRIQIVDVNDNSPAFFNPPQMISVSELTPVGTTLCSARFLTCDLDEGPNKQVNYALTGSCVSHFSVNSTNGLMKVLDNLDYESSTEFDCVMIASDEGNPSMSSSTSFTINILDVDDLGPEFVYSSCDASTEPQGKTCIAPSYKTSIASNSAEQSTLVFMSDPAVASNPDGTVDIIMQDRDAIGAEIVCRIAETRPAGYASYFTATASLISGKQYKCTVMHQANQPINYASVPELEIIIEAVEDAGNRRTEAATIYVEITTDTNTDTTTVGTGSNTDTTTVGTASNTDTTTVDTSSTPKTTTVDTSSDPCSGSANINIAFPELDTPLTISPGDSQYAQVILHGSEPFSVTIESDPTAPNNFPFDEYFSHSYNTFGSTPGYTVYMIKGIDRDGATCGVDDDTNILQYTLVCTSTANSDPLFKILKIQIKDVNDNAPAFSNPPQMISVSELTPVGTTLCARFPTCDLDEGPNKQVNYALSGSCVSDFSVDSTEGLLTVLNNLDYESSTEFDCVMIASDEGTPAMSSSTSFTIKILDVDDLGPEFVYSSCIASTEPQGESCIAPRYKTSIASNSAEQSTLVFMPDPTVASNPDGTVDIIMQDRDAIGSEIVCRIAATRPAGYASYFTATASLISGKQYKCTVMHKANQPIDHTSVPELDIIIEAVQDAGNRRTEAATIHVEITGSNTETTTVDTSGGCPDNGGSMPTSSSLLFIITIGMVFLFSSVILS